MDAAVWDEPTQTRTPGRRSSCATVHSKDEVPARFLVHAKRVAPVPLLVVAVVRQPELARVGEDIKIELAIVQEADLSDKDMLDALEPAIVREDERDRAPRLSSSRRRGGGWSATCTADGPDETDEDEVVVPVIVVELGAAKTEDVNLGRGGVPNVAENIGTEEKVEVEVAPLECAVILVVWSTTKVVVPTQRFPISR